MRLLSSAPAFREPHPRAASPEWHPVVPMAWCLLLALTPLPFMSWAGFVLVGAGWAALLLVQAREIRNRRRLAAETARAVLPDLAREAEAWKGLETGSPDALLALGRLDGVAEAMAADSTDEPTVRTAIRHHALPFIRRHAQRICAEPEGRLRALHELWRDETEPPLQAWAGVR